MATITTINATDLLSASRAVINTNFANLNTDKVDGAAALTTAGRLVEVASSGVATQTSFASSVVVLTSGSYADPAWVTSLATTKLTGTLQAAQFPALTGDVTTSAGAVATTLANTAVTPASYGSATQVATFTVDSKGRLTAAASTSIAIAASQVTSGTLDNARTTAASTNTVSAIVARDASGNFAAGTITATFSGNLTGNVTGNVSGTAATITGALALANTPLTTRGDLLVATTATPILGRLAKGTQYQVLTGGATDPTWGAVDLSQATAITGTLPVGNGGTGETTLAGAGIVVGSASLTTANALPIVASAGTLGQSDISLASGILSRAGTLGLSATGANVITFTTNGTERGRWSSGGKFLIGTTTDNGYGVSVANGLSAYGFVQVDTNNNARVGSYLDSGGSGEFFLWNSSGTQTIGLRAGTGVSYFNGGNVIVGNNANGNYRLDVGSSGSSGTVRVYDQTATTGVTSLVVRAGAGQSTTALFSLTRNDASTLGQHYAYVIAGSLIGDIWQSNNSNGAGVSAVGFQLSSAGQLTWHSGTITSWGSTAADTGFSRASAGVIEVNNGTAGTYRDLLSRSYIGTATSAATMANSQFTFHLASDTSLVVTAKGSDGTLRSVALTLAP